MKPATSPLTSSAGRKGRCTPSSQPMTPATRVAMIRPGMKPMWMLASQGTMGCRRKFASFCSGDMVRMAQV